MPRPALKQIQINQALEQPTPEAAEQAFPSARYFQVHFEYLQEQMQAIERNQQALLERMQQLERRLALLGGRDDAARPGTGLEGIFSRPS